MAVRIAETEIQYSDFNRWGEPLDQGVHRVLAENLTHVLGIGPIRRNAWRTEDVDLALKVTIQRFEADKDGDVILQAEWQIIGNRPAAGQLVLRTSGPPPGMDPAGTVLAMSNALDELSRRIAADLHDSASGSR